MRVFFVAHSSNAKTGDIPQTYQTSDTCAKACPHREEGCYARFSHTGRIWVKLDSGAIGGSWKKLLAVVRTFKEGQLWRYGVTGDLPGKGNRIAPSRLRELVEANRGRRGFAFSHKTLTPFNSRLIREANEKGFTINLSADSLTEADRKADTGAGPTVVTMPADPKDWPQRTPAGRKVVPCPAVTRNLTCENCGICAVSSRKAIIGFPAHGVGKNKVEKVYFSE